MVGVSVAGHRLHVGRRLARTRDGYRCKYCPTNDHQGQAVTHTINLTHKVAVANDVYWQPIETAPRGVKVQLLGKGNVATYGTYFGDKFWTHWCPLPKKQKETT